jgi:hypothetical protein
MEATPSIGTDVSSVGVLVLAAVACGPLTPAEPRTATDVSAEAAPEEPDVVTERRAGARPLTLLEDVIPETMIASEPSSQPGGSSGDQSQRLVSSSDQPRNVPACVTRVTAARRRRPSRS